MTKIEWTDITWNPIVGCSVVSPGCTNCYAMRMAARLERMGIKRYAGLTQPSTAGPVWTEQVNTAEQVLTQPLRWKKSRRVFVNSMGDLFHENVPDEWIDRVFAIMALCPHYTFQVLTKRSKRMRDYCKSLGRHHTVDRLSLQLKEWHRSGFLENMGFFYDMRDEGWCLDNVWLGVTAEDQTRADERIPDLLETPAAVRFVSCEPLLCNIDLSEWLAVANITLCGQPHWTELTGYVSKLDWVIAGGETGPRARVMLPDWARSLRDQCKAAAVPFFFKQCGAVATADPLCFGKQCAGRLLDGVEHNGMPEVENK